MLRVQYASKETWEIEENILRCTPMFNKKPRFDAVLVETNEGPIFARLLMLFTISSSRSSNIGQRIPLAIIEPYDAPVSTQLRKRDQSLQMLRVRPQRAAVPEVIFARSIIRGTLLIPDWEASSSDFMVFDILDSDMFLRAKEMRADPAFKL
jgi:hypothetical protein